MIANNRIYRAFEQSRAEKMPIMDSGSRAEMQEFISYLQGSGVNFSAQVRNGTLSAKEYDGATVYAEILIDIED